MLLLSYKNISACITNQGQKTKSAVRVHGDRNSALGMPVDMWTCTSHIWW